MLRDKSLSKSIFWVLCFNSHQELFFFKSRLGKFHHALADRMKCILNHYEHQYWIIHDLVRTFECTPPERNCINPNRTPNCLRLVENISLRGCWWLRRWEDKHWQLVQFAYWILTMMTRRMIVDLTLLVTPVSDPLESHLLDRLQLQNGIKTKMFVWQWRW